VKLDAINPGKWFGDQFAKMLGAEKTLVQKSRLFRPRRRRQRRRPPPDQELHRPRRGMRAPAREWRDRRTTKTSGGILRAIEFPRIKGGKPFDPATPWFGELLAGIGQPQGATVHVQH